MWLHNCQTRALKATRGVNLAGPVLGRAAAVLRSHRAAAGRVPMALPALGRASQPRVLQPCRVAAPEAPQAELPLPEELTYVDQLNMEYGIPGMIQFSYGMNGLPRVWLKHIDSCMGVEIYLHGATLTQWLRPNGSNALDQHPAMKLDPDSSNKGAGLRLVFPVYKAGTTMTLDDGFAGRMPWEVVAAGLTCMPIPDGLQGDGYEPARQEYLRLEQEHPEVFGENPVRPWNPFAESDGMIEVDLPEPDLEEQVTGEEATGEEAAGEEEARAEAEKREQPKKRGRPKKTPTPEPEQQQQAVLEQQQQQEEEEGGVGEGEGEGEVDLEGEEGEEPEYVNPEDVPEEERIYGTEAALDMLAKLQDGFDPAPFVTLRLTDNEQTRAIWPHKFELLYKITIMETDDFPSVEVSEGTDGISFSDSLAVIAEEDMEARSEQIEETPEPVLPTGGRVDEDTGLDVPVQLKLELVVVNRDPEDSEEMMEFEVAALLQFATQDILRRGDAVKVLGLGNRTAIDYAHDERFGAIMSNENGDFMHFVGQKIDCTFPRALQSDVKLAPGDGTHYEFLPRGGFTDVMLHHPGVNPHAINDPQSKLVTLGVGRVLAPKRLAPGQFWEAEFVVRWHNHAWQSPIFGDDTPYIPPMDAQGLCTGGMQEASGDDGNLFAALEDDFTGEGGEDGTD